MASLRSTLTAAAIGTLGVALAFGPTVVETVWWAKHAEASAWTSAGETSAAWQAATAATATPAPRGGSPALAPTSEAAGADPADRATPAAGAPTPAATTPPANTAANSPANTATPAAPPAKLRTAPPNPAWPTMTIPPGVPRGPALATHVNGRPIVYLTFDDGPDPTWTPQILQLLAANKATATFFMIGQEAQRNPTIVQAVRRAGHAVGNHSFTHPWLTDLAPSQIRDELARTDAALGGTTCMRPPGGMVDAKVGAVLKDRKSVVQLWDTDTRDWSAPGAPAILKAVDAQLRPGVVILMHDGGGDRSQSVAATKTLLPRLRAAGYVMLPLPECR